MIELFFPFFLFRQLCLYISDSLHLFTLFLTDSLKKCQTKSFENEYSTFCNVSTVFPIVLNSCSLIADDGGVHKLFWRTLPTPNPSYYCLYRCKYIFMHLIPSIGGIHSRTIQDPKTLNRNSKAKQRKFIPI